MQQRLFLFSVIAFLLIFTSKGIGQVDVVEAKVEVSRALPRSLPEKEGVSSEAIFNFLTAAEKSRTEFHSFMMLRHGKVIAEGWWDPYAPNLKHTLYSCSKSFTATAIGFAVSENLLTVNDKVVSFFPHDLPDTVSSFLAQLTIKDLLSMSVGQEPDPTSASVSKDSNWVKSFFRVPILYKPGTKFLYNSLGTYMLSAIVQKVSGQNLIDYLKPRLFDPLGIQGMDWEVDPKGVNTGGWGLRVKTEDMAKFGQLFLQKGKWQGKQILPVAWINEASTAKIIQHPEYSQAKRDSSDWEQGYCYQMWRCRNNAYRADGAFGQFIIIMPDQDAVIVFTAETPSMQEQINLVWEYLLPALKTKKLPVDKNRTAMLKQKLSSLALPVPPKAASAAMSDILNKAFLIAPNEKKIKNIAFNFLDSFCSVRLEADTAVYRLRFGNGSWQTGETSRYGPSLVAAAKASFVGLPPLKVNGAYTWKDENTLELTLRYIESPHTEKITCLFDGNTISVVMENSFDYGKKKTELRGVLQE